jgi:hypothetical protein
MAHRSARGYGRPLVYRLLLGEWGHIPDSSPSGAIVILDTLNTLNRQLAVWGWLAGARNLDLGCWRVGFAGGPK